MLRRLPFLAASLAANLMIVAALEARGENLPDPHPLVPVLEYARQIYAYIDREIDDYTCYLAKQEQIDGRLRSPETMYVKIRHQQTDDSQVTAPMSVYLRFFSPASKRDREVLYVHGRHDNKMIVRNGGNRFAYITTALPLDSAAARQESRYRLTEIGLKNLVARLIETGQSLLDRADIEVKVLDGAKVDSRPCRLIQIKLLESRDDDIFYMARVFVDEELGLPVRYAAYNRPTDEAAEPSVLEEYTYTKLRLNPGLSDYDFDHRNPNYLFLKSFEP